MKFPISNILIWAATLSAGATSIAQTAASPEKGMANRPFIFDALRSFGARGGENSYPGVGGVPIGTGTTGTGTTGTGGTGTGATGNLSGLPNRGGISIKRDMQPNSSPALENRSFNR